MTDPRILILFSAVFLLLGGYNAYKGFLRLREARRQGNPMRWYKQLQLLTGVEYVLLAFVFVLSISNSLGALSPAVRNILFPIYLVFLLGAAVLAGIVIRQSMLNARAARAQAMSRTGSGNGPTSIPGESNVVDSETQKNARAQQVERQRERRKNAAAARRRRAGKA